MFSCLGWQRCCSPHTNQIFTSLTVMCRISYPAQHFVVLFFYPQFLKCDPADELTCSSEATGLERPTLYKRKALSRPHRAEGSIFYFGPERGVERSASAGALTHYWCNLLHLYIYILYFTIIIFGNSAADTACHISFKSLRVRLVW